MEDLRYFGTYARFDTPSKKEGAALVGADNLVGDDFDIVFKRTDEGTVAWLVNRFGKEVGFFDAATSRHLGICQARGWKMRALLSFVAFTESPDPGIYWGEMALICNDRRYDAECDAFAARMKDLLCEGIRPEVDLGTHGIDSMIAAQGEWEPSRRVPFPEKGGGTVLMKKRRKLSEKAIEQGRRGNKGCYAVSWAFLAIVAAAVIAGILFGLKGCGVL